MRSSLTALTLGAALLLSGCSGVSADDAAVIEGRHVDEQALQEATQQINSIATEPTTPAQLISDLTKAPVLDRVMAGTEVELTDRQVTDALADAGLSEPNDLSIDVARTRQYVALLQDPGFAQSESGQVAMGRLTEITEADFAAMDVQVNPRYGSWEPAQAGLVDRVPDWISPDR